MPREFLLTDPARLRFREWHTPTPQNREEVFLKHCDGARQFEGSSSDFISEAHMSESIVGNLYSTRIAPELVRLRLPVTQALAEIHGGRLERSRRLYGYEKVCAVFCYPREL